MQHACLTCAQRHTFATAPHYRPRQTGPTDAGGMWLCATCYLALHDPARPFALRRAYDNAVHRLAGR